ncbi:cytochrome P450 [Spongiibacter sp. KMU-166]|uniref:Cytochrome P450 n=1 Tax=Spongiibacter thalassae TaxID=2721624 RepID=A0ABX1GBI3_9GAMM|nr:cytochrome P450 [Spongiibacter thalassae]NKI15862.1 cytochrome P450 [Spongiibacter thalassae]
MLVENIPQSSEIPGPRGLPFIGVIPRFLQEPLALFEDAVRKYGQVFKLPLGGKEIVFLNDPSDIENVLRLDFRSYGQSATHEDLLAPLLGRGVASVSDHAYWEQLHRILLPAFTPKMLKKYFEQTALVIQSEVDHLEELRLADSNVELYEFVRLGIFTALTKTLFVRGIESDEIPGILELFLSSNNYINARYLTNASRFTAILPAIRKGRRDLKKIDKRVYELIAYRKENRVEEAEDMLDTLLEARFSDGTALSDVELRDNITSLFFGGQETTPSEVTWAFGLLAANPDKRQIMLNEIDEVLADRIPTFDDLSKLVYTGMVFDEAMRLYPAFSFLAREALIDTTIRGYSVKKGTPIAFPGWTIHRNEDYWPDSEKFLPERHAKEISRKRAKCSFMSFGYGQRRCIGERVARMESTLMLAMVSQRFLLEHADGRLPDPRVQMSIKPVGKMPMKIIKRYR